MMMGVFFPTTTSILGVLLFLRLPWVVGKAGVFQACGLVAVCCVCTFATTLSLSAVATNGQIKAGGSYFLISRSLGPALGASVGISEFIANSIGAAMYFMGTVEAWEVAFPDAQILEVGTINNIRVTSFIVLAGGIAVVSGGIKIVSRVGTCCLICVFITMICMFLGCLVGPVDGVGTSRTYGVDVMIENVKTSISLTWSGVAGGHLADNFGPAYDQDQLAFPADTTEYGFITVMALWFPACSGIMSGSHRSANLKDPASSIPSGTLLAQVVTTTTYLVFILLYGASAPRTTLLHDKIFAASSSFLSRYIVIFGVMASAMGAGLSALVSGSKLLSAVAADGTMPVLRVFAVESGNEPRLALLATSTGCALALAIGELNAVAPILTMFFLLCYACVNVACALLELVSDPNWRPTFRYYHWIISLVGAGLSLWMMIAISPLFAFLSIVICGIIFVYAAYHSNQVRWGDGFQGMKFSVARNILMKLDVRSHTKNWRPQLLVVTHAQITDKELEILDVNPMLIASQLQGGRGITIVGGVCCAKKSDVFSSGGPFMTAHLEEQMADGQDEMLSLLQEYGIAGFGRLVYTENFSSGLTSLLQVAGLGAFQPNCVLIQWPNHWDLPDDRGQEKRIQFIRLVQVSVAFQKVMLITKGSFPELTDRLDGTVDIWWVVADGGILLLLPFLLRKHKVWANCRLRLFVLDDDNDPETHERELEAYLRDFRLNIEVHVKSVAPTSEPPTNTAATQGPSTICEYGDVAPEDEGGLTVSGPSFLADGIHRWRHHMDDEVPSQPGSDHRDVNADTVGSKKSWKSQNSHSYRREHHGVVDSVEELLHRVGFHHEGFASSPPASIGSHTGHLFKNALHGYRHGHDPSEAGTLSGDAQALRSTAAEVHSDAPCNAQDLAIAQGLNKFMQEFSCDAELVVTNLPDTPPGVSAFGYCQLVEALSSGLKRSLLVRGTAHEVITAFT